MSSVDDVSRTGAQDVADQFDLGGAARFSGPVMAGRVGTVRRLDNDRGLSAVKTVSEVPDPVILAEQVDLQQRALAAGVPTPTVIRTPSGDVVAPVNGCLVRVSGWAELAPPDRWVDPVAIGELMAALHLVRVPPSGPVHMRYAHPVPAACWTQLVDKLRSADAPFAEGVASAVPDLVEITRHTVTVQPIQQGHLDLFADNVRALPDGRLCVIDSDNAGPGDPSQELARWPSWSTAHMTRFGCGSCIPPISTQVDPAA